MLAQQWATLLESRLLPESLSEYIICELNQAIQLYYRLILVVAPTDIVRTVSFKEVAEHTGSRYINVNLKLSQRLLELTQRQRALQVHRLLEEIIGNTNNQVVLLDHLEILFEVSLKLDPLRCLQGLARNRTVVAGWNGSLENNYLIYAEPDHPEYRCYQKSDFLVVSPREPT